MPTDEAVSPLRLHLDLFASSASVSLVDVPDDRPPLEVLFVQLQRIRTRLERRTASTPPWGAASLSPRRAQRRRR